MYIAQLNLKDFKSFGGGHELPLSPGFTAIVGPNGSGKSNLLDGLRWVLGEGSPGRLRVTRQQDLIFQGCASLGAAREAEVTLHLRDDRRKAVLRRRFDAEGGGTLLLDGAKIRLQDLEGFKRHWHLEGDRFAFIGQGEVAEVIQQRPLQRRLHLEGLFGIDVYRRKRDEAAERLVRSADELARLLTLVAELETRRRQIAPEVERARQARDLLSTLDDDRRLLYWLRRAETESALGKARQAEEEQVIRTEALALWTARWESLRRRLEERAEDLGGSRLEGERRREALSRDIEALVRKAFSLSTACLEKRRRLGVIGAERDEIEAKGQTLSEERQASRTSLEEAESLLSDRKTRLADLEARWEETRRDLDARRREREALLSRKAEIETALDRAGHRRKALEREGRDLEAALLEKGTHRDRLASGLEALQADLDEVRRAFEKVLDSHGRSYARCQELGAAIQQLRRESARSRQSLDELVERAENDLYPRPVRHVIAAARLGRLEASPVPVLEVFSCPPDLSSPLEAFLGGRAFWLLVETFEEAQRCIEQLKGRQEGRATFLPLERCRPRTPSPLAGKEGVVGWARDLVTVDSRWQAAWDHLMGDLLVVETYRTGSDLVRGGLRAPVVTLDGDVFQPGGTVSGGRARKGPGALELRRLREEARSRLDEQTDRLARLEEAFAEEEKGELAAAAEKEGLSIRLRDLETQCADFSRRLDLEDRELKALADDRDRIVAELKALDELAFSGRAELDDLDGRLGAFGDLPQEDHLGAEVGSARAEVALAEERTRSLAALAARTEREAAELATRLSRLDVEEKTLAEGEGEAKAELARIGQSYLNLWRQRCDLERSSNEESLRRKRLMTQISRAQYRARYAREAERLQDEALQQLRLRRMDLERELASLCEQWEETSPYPGAEALPDEDLDAVRRRVRELERALRRLGDPDMGVLSEDKSLLGRLEFLGAQVKDVQGAMAELRELIEATDREAGRLFAEALKGIDGGFNALFRRLFNGGEAHLEMADGQSTWDAGVEVIARPPGKSPQNLRQLSGGEQSLSAIALLFASMEVAKVPLAVLDEVDAALDEVNLRRFAELAREYAQRLQLIAMTHRRITMERADVMFGVTLSEPGLSQVVGVRLDEWD
ncbi:MAG: chromosome segregation protein SMC [Synergistaceae bacterium]|nr:chromosome segregation protein SMC [Synergistaceae bacterium]